MMLENIKINMQKFNTLKSTPAYLPIINIDTDMIIPKQFLKTIKRTGLGKNLFFEMRYDDNGKEINDFVLNKDPYSNSKISILPDLFSERAISSKPSNKHFFLNESTLNFVSLFPKITFSSLRSMKISSFLLAYSDSSLIVSSSKIIGKIPFLKQLL